MKRKKTTKKFLFLIKRAKQKLIERDEVNEDERRKKSFLFKTKENYKKN